MIKTLKKHASLRGVSNANDEANQLTEFRRGQSASVTILTDFAALNRLGCRAGLSPLTVKSCDFSVRIWNRLSRLAMTQSVGFTMAEILLSLTIIGVVAAITLPSLMANINERTWNTQRKALYARMSQAIAMMPQLNGYGEYEGSNTDGSVTATKDTAAEAFLTEGLSKVLKINNICDATHLADCGVAASFTNLAGSTKTWPTKLSELNSMFTGSYDDNGASEGGNVYRNPQQHIDTKAAAFETQNGETIALYYNPQCTADVEGNAWHYSQPKMCANFIYDLNGNKGPNAVGKDIGFITALYSLDSNIVAPYALSTNANGGTSVTQIEAGAKCSAQDPESRLPNKDELTAMFFNKELLGITSGTFWSSSVISSGESGKAWRQHFPAGFRYPLVRSSTHFVRCVKR